MEVMVVDDIPGVDAATYERRPGGCGRRGRIARGLIIHGAGSTEVGWRVLSSWRSREAFERFRDERLLPAVRSLRLPLPPTFERSEVHRINQPRPSPREPVTTPG
jgi:hypothetical protein